VWERKEPKEENISQKGKEGESAIGADMGCGKKGITIVQLRIETI